MRQRTCTRPFQNRHSQARAQLPTWRHDRRSPPVRDGGSALCCRGRPPYSAQLVDVLRQRSASTGQQARSIELRTGRARGAVGAAVRAHGDRHRSRAAAMLAEARRHAAARDVEMDWVEARAEDLATLKLPAARLVTFGQSIHWTDRQPVLAMVHELLTPGGAVALIAPAIEHGSPPVDQVAPPTPHDEIEALLGQYLGWSRQTTRADTYETSLERSPFGESHVAYAPGRTRHRPHDRRGRLWLPLHVLRRTRSLRRSPRRLRDRSPDGAHRCLTRGPLPRLARRHRSSSGPQSSVERSAPGDLPRTLREVESLGAYGGGHYAD